MVGGIIMVIFGINASQSFASDVSKFFTGTPTDKAVWLVIVGCILTIIGLIFSFKRSTSP